MLITVKTAFEDVENGSLKEGGYYFELTTPYSRYTSGCYPEQEKYGFFPRLDAVLKYIIAITSLIRKLMEVEWLHPPGSKKKIPRRRNMSCIRLPIRIILVVSVLTGQTEASPIATEEQPLTLTAGRNGIIPFTCRNEQQSPLKFYKIKFEEKDRPFYSKGSFDLDGLMSPDQAERFRVEHFEEGSSMSVEINVASVSIEDQGTYIVVLFIQGETHYHLMKRIVLIFIPPSPAVCFLMPSETEITYEVHCHSKPGNGNSTLTCFQNDNKIPYQSPSAHTQIVYSRVFWLMDTDIPVSCCSHDIKEIKTITQTSCDQYRHPWIEPANSPVPPVHEIHTKMAPNMEEKNSQPSSESTSYSGCGQSFDRPTVMLPIMALFAYVCLSNP
ncbi:uncharacterized protein LOC100889022 [Strongylocentrotus purpuratus]|uniref:Uncharacterized protein n=1 Tax=Strongylocentrotus purpuratus TaxID=7668 RepID=A0A7M7HHP2_STRPU|nr:uncharacterized protein LOC100889022 [Strongylocentrotus purpuratus]|eukprot:XP_011677379.1 PREDICTED: uncharacterized protein LOC100889022 [Strongylocentrotus purpuratus]